MSVHSYSTNNLSSNVMNLWKEPLQFSESVPHSVRLSSKVNDYIIMIGFERQAFVGIKKGHHWFSHEQGARRVITALGQTPIICSNLPPIIKQIQNQLQHDDNIENYRWYGWWYAAPSHNFQIPISQWPPVQMSTLKKDMEIVAIAACLS